MRAVSIDNQSFLSEKGPRESTNARYYTKIAASTVICLASIICMASPVCFIFGLLPFSICLILFGVMILVMVLASFVLYGLMNPKRSSVEDEFKNSIEFFEKTDISPSPGVAVEVEVAVEEEVVAEFFEKTDISPSPEEAVKAELADDDQIEKQTNKTSNLSLKEKFSQYLENSGVSPFFKDRFRFLMADIFSSSQANGYIDYENNSESVCVDLMKCWVKIERFLITSFVEIKKIDKNFLLEHRDFVSMLLEMPYLYSLFRTRSYQETVNQENGFSSVKRVFPDHELTDFHMSFYQPGKMNDIRIAYNNFCFTINDVLCNPSYQYSEDFRKILAAYFHPDEDISFAIDIFEQPTKPPEDLFLWNDRDPDDEDELVSKRLLS